MECSHPDACVPGLTTMRDRGYLWCQACRLYVHPSTVSQDAPVGATPGALWREELAQAARERAAQPFGSLRRLVGPHTRRARRS